MNAEQINNLKNACSQIWRDLDNKDSNLSFGIQCDAGWYGLLMNLTVTLLIELSNFPEPDFHFTEVKEKYGKLVIRHQGSENDDVYIMVDTYCDDSLKVCELCGEDGSLRQVDETKKTLCNKCFTAMIDKT